LLTASMPERSKYPQAAATMQPTRRPITTAVDFIIGLPKRSHKMIVRKTRKPRPMKEALPHSSAWGASMAEVKAVSNCPGELVAR
jgi:hypothetical protein